MNSLTKKNLLLSTVVTVILALITNFAFCQFATLFVGTGTANITNNVFDSFSLAFYVYKAFKLYGKLDKYTIPAITGNLVSLFA